jgi:hypothetical protein
VLALLAAERPATRGAVTAMAGLTKFAPLALAPLMATYRRPVRFTLAFAIAAAVLMLPAYLGAGIGVFWERTLEFQSERGSPFSVWGFREGWETPQRVVQAGAVVLALVVAFVPRRRDVVTLAALAAAVLVAVQLGVTHWFYLYVVWFLPPVLLALLGRDLVGRDEVTPAAPAPAAARSSPPVAAPTP